MSPIKLSETERKAAEERNSRPRITVIWDSPAARKRRCQRSLVPVLLIGVLAASLASLCYLEALSSCLHSQGCADDLIEAVP